jgi:uncharacterized protein YukE
MGMHVDLAAIGSLAEHFDREARELRSNLEAFDQSIRDVGKAFGVLGACDGAATQYHKLADTTTSALHDLSRSLDTGADTLRAQASAYRSTEDGNTVDVADIDLVSRNPVVFTLRCYRRASSRWPG